MKAHYMIITIFILVYSTVSFSQCEGFSMTISSSNPTCHQFSDGIIIVNHSGGNGFVTIVISDSTGTVLIPGGTQNNLPAGWYYITATDELGCNLTDSIELVDPGPFSADLITNDLLCSYDDSGWAYVDTVYNYQGNYNNISYFWNPNPAGIGGVGADSSYNMQSGTYTLTINDELGCSFVVQINIDSPPLMYFSEIGFDPCTDGAFGIVWAAAGGGTPDYNYTWTDLQTMAFSNNTTWGGLSPGDYAIEVTDANGCVLTDTITLGCVGVEENTDLFNVYPNPASGVFVIESTNSAIQHVLIFDALGNSVGQIEIKDGKTTIDLYDEADGIYYLQIIEGENTYCMSLMLRR